MKKLVHPIAILLILILPFMITAQTCGNITPSGPISICVGSSTILTAPLATAYLWSSGQITRSITVTAGGVYTVHVINSDGCTGNTTPTTVTVLPLPTTTVTANGPTTFCQGGSVTLTAAANADYAWSNGNSTQAITVTTTGDYFVTVTSTNGCSAANKGTLVTVNLNPAAVITPAGKTFCGASEVLTVTADSLYRWTTGATTRSITATTSGIYGVTITNSDKCTSTTSDTITISPVPTATVTAGGPLTFCQGGSVTLSVPPGNTYHWSSGQTTASIIVTTSGSYAVTATGPTGCSAASGATVVTVNANPTAVITPAGNSFCGSTILTVTSDSLYKWTTGATTRSITATTSGVYGVTITNSDKCTSSTTDTITISPIPSATITANGPLTFCQGGSVTLSVPSGNTYHWSSGQTTASIIVTTTGSYAVTATGPTGCSAASNATVATVNPAASATIAPGSPVNICFGTAIILSAPVDSIYKWSTGATTRTITVTAGGTYTVTATNPGNCTASGSDTVIVSPLPSTTVIANGPLKFCQGGSVTLSAPPGNTYRWTNGQTTDSIVVTTSGNYAVIVTGPTGCSEASGITVVTVSPVPTAIITTTSLCNGAGTLTVNTDSLYRWNTGATSRSITATTSGVYTVTVTNSGNCTATATDTVTVTGISVDSILSNGPLTFCKGDSVTLNASFDNPDPDTYIWNTGQDNPIITVTASGNYSVIVVDAINDCTVATGTAVVTVDTVSTLLYTVTNPCGPVTLIVPSDSLYHWSTGATTESITTTSSGDYSVTVTDSNGCSAVLRDSIVIKGLLPAVISAKDFCGSIRLTVSSDSIYRWNTGATTQTITVTTPGIYTVTATNSGNCTVTASDTITFIPGLIADTIQSSGPVTFCPGGGVTLFVPTVFGNSYHWNTGQNTPYNAVNTGGNYSITVTDSTGCSATASITVTLFPYPAGHVDVVNYCDTTILTAGGSSSYLWNTGATTPGIYVESDGIYTVILTDSNNCRLLIMDTVNIIVPSTVTITPVGPISICKGDTVVLTAVPHLSAGNFFSIYWSNGVQNRYSINVTDSGSYNAVIYDVNSCMATSNTVVVNLNPAPTPVITTSGGCSSATLTLVDSNAFLYVWSTLAFSKSIVVNSSGIYSVSVSDYDGCTAVATDTVAINGGITVLVTASGPVTFCKGDSVTLTAQSFEDSAAVKYTWNTGATTAAITVFTSGTYTVTATDTSGCSASESVPVTVHSPFSQIVIIDSTSTLCTSDSLRLTVSNATSYQWSTNETTPVISIDTPGIYSVIISDSFHCLVHDTITIIKGANCCNKFTPQFTINDSMFCGSDTMCFNISGGTDFDLSIDSGGVITHILSGVTPSSSCLPVSSLINTPGFYTLTAVIYVIDGKNILCSDTIQRTIYIKPSCSCACMCADTCPYLHADFTYTVYQGYMVLRDSSIGNPTYDEWFIGGQTYITSPGDSLVYTFQHSGYYQVCLTIHHLVYGSDLCCVADTCILIYGPVDTCSLLHLNAGVNWAPDFSQPLTYSFVPNTQVAVPNVVIWNFGDSTTLTTDSVTPINHTFPNAGIYEVCVNQIWLLPNNYCCIDSQCVTVAVTSSPILLQGSPNPFKNTIQFKLNIIADGAVQLELYNAMGELQTVLINAENFQTGSYTRSFDLSSLPGGIYTYRFITNQGSETGKLIKE